MNGNIKIELRAGPSESADIIVEFVTFLTVSSYATRFDRNYILLAIFEKQVDK